MTRFVPPLLTRDEINLRFPSMIYAFNTVNIAGAIGTLALFLTALISPRVQRLREWYLFMSLWFLTSASNLLLIGAQLTDTKPGLKWCLFQASMIYAAPPSYIKPFP